jgi:hypothetical protein
MAELSSTIAQLDTAWRALQQRWAATKSLWSDKVSRDFERELWVQLEGQVPATQREMQRLAEVIAKARRNVK